MFYTYTTFSELTNVLEKNLLGLQPELCLLKNVYKTKLLNRWDTLITNVLTKDSGQILSCFPLKIKLYVPKTKLNVRSICYILIYRPKLKNYISNLLTSRSTKNVLNLDIGKLTTQKSHVFNIFRMKCIT